MDRGMQVRLFVRSLFLQACWNDRGMQNLGLGLCMEPWLRRLYPGAGPGLREARRRQMESFNTQPYMASVIVGTASRLEEAARQGSPAALARLATLKAGLASSLAAVGDAIFWGALRPLAALAALAAWLGLRLLSVDAAPAWGIALYLAMFNGPALWVRWRGLRYGYEMGEGIVAALQRLDWKVKLRRLRWAGLGLSGALAAAALGAPAWDLQGVVVKGGLLAGGLALRAAGVSTIRAYGVLACAGAALALFGAA